MISTYCHYINREHPVYKGFDTEEKTKVKVVLKSWSDEIKLGSGEIHFYHDQDSELDMDDVGAKGNQSRALASPCSFVIKGKFLSFINDDYCESTFMAFKISKDFHTLTLVDKISEKSIKTLVVKKVETSLNK